MKESDALLLVGRVWRAHGVKGEFKVIPETDDPDRLADLRTVYVGPTAESARPHEVQAIRYQPTSRGLIVVLKLAGIDSREAADEIRKIGIFALEDDLPPLGEDEYFLHDLVGLRVYTDQGVEIGEVGEVMEFPAHEVLVVDRRDGGSAMIPAVPEFIETIDLDAGRIVIRPIEGLIE